jgi:DNA-binding response OmpR family regulator
METILLIGQADILETCLGLALSEAGYAVIIAFSIIAGLKAAYDSEPDMAIVDQPSLPNCEEFCTQIRRLSDVPVVALVDNDEAALKLLQSGADACLSRAAKSQLVLASVRPLLKRCKRWPCSPPACVDLDTDRRIASLDGTTAELTRAEFRLFFSPTLN